MKSLPVLLIALLGSGPIVRAADREFSDVVRAISDEFQTRPTRIPLFGMVNAFVSVVKPAGAKHIDLAVFEDLNRHDRIGGPLREQIRGAVGGSWKPFVQVVSSHGRREESVFIYVRQQKDDWNLLVTSIERDEAVVMQIRLNPDGLVRWLADPQKCARNWRGGDSY